MSKKLLTNLLSDERRNMYSTSSHPSQQHPGLLYNGDSSLGQLNLDVPTTPNINIATTDKQNQPGLGLYLEKKHIIINSGDRDWINRTDESAYNYSVSVGTGSSMSNGRNINITVNTALENIHSISCDMIVLSNRAQLNGFKPSNQSFLLVNVEGVNDIVKGSNKWLDNSLGQMVNKIPLPLSLDNLKYIQMVNHSNASKIFNTPEAKIGRMAVSVARADGTLLNYGSGIQTDVLNITRAYYTVETPILKTLNIITTGYFNNLDWQTGDIIQIRNYIMRGTDVSNPGYFERVKFNTWINRDEGHIIQDIARTTEGPELYNILKIYVPGNWSSTSGDFELTDWFSDLITKTEIDINSGTDTGKILNENLQTTLYLTCEVLTKNSAKLLRDIALY